MIRAGKPKDWRRELTRRLRLTLAELAPIMPVSAAAALARRESDGPFELLAEVRPEVDDARASPQIVLSAGAVEWLEVNRRELVLELRPGYRESELYLPLIENGIPAAVISPILYVDELSGVVVITTRRRTCTTERQLRMIRVLVPKLAELVPPPMAEAWEIEVGTPDPGDAGAVEDEKPSVTVVEEEHSLRADLTPQQEEPVARGAPAEAPADESASAVEASAANAQDIRLEADALGRVDEWTERAERVFGWSHEEVVGSFLTLFYRNKHRHLLDPTLREELLKDGRFEGRAICYSRDGLPVTCEMTLSELQDPDGRATGFSGSFRVVKPNTLLPREDIEFGFARLYAFTNPLKP